MSAYSDLDQDLSTQAAKIKSSVAAFADDARDQLAMARQRGLELAQSSRQQAGALARAAGDQVRKRPVATGLVAAIAGIGLVFLLSSRARALAASAAQPLLDSLAKRS